MGGNIKIGEYKAEPILFTEEKTRDHWRFELGQFMSQLCFVLELKYHMQVHVSDTYYTGSTFHLMNPHLRNDTFLRIFKKMGDFDVQMPLSSREAVEELLSSDSRVIAFYKCIGMKRHGHESSFLLTHYDGGPIIQLDIQYTDDPGSPEEQFLHSSNIHDLELGIKGAHHKLLLNALGMDKYKFSITHGLRLRTENVDWPGTKQPPAIYYLLFNTTVLEYTVDSFTGLIYSARYHFSQEDRKIIFDKFVSSCKTVANMDHSYAIDYAKRLCS